MHHFLCCCRFCLMEFGGVWWYVSWEEEKREGGLERAEGCVGKREEVQCCGGPSWKHSHALRCLAGYRVLLHHILDLGIVPPRHSMPISQIVAYEWHSEVREEGIRTWVVISFLVLLCSINMFTCILTSMPNSKGAERVMCCHRPGGVVLVGIPGTSFCDTECVC